MKIKWSSYQKDIFKDVAHGSGNTVIIARAGSAKTTTIIESLKYLPIKEKPKSLFVAFNKSIAEELKNKVTDNVEALTLHSLGYRTVKNNLGNVTLDNYKVKNIINNLFKVDWELNQSLCRIVSLCKGYLVDSPSRIIDLMDQFDIETFDFDQDQFVAATIKILTKCKDTKNIIDFDDMIYFPVMFNMNVGKYDYVFIDEAQDLNKCQITMALSAKAENGRIIACGDPRQCIYSWRSADKNAIDLIIEKTEAKTLTLPISYRCPISVIKLAQEIVPDIQHSDFAKEGEILHITPTQMLKEVKAGDVILSRVNAPLVKHCMQLLKNGIPANIQGRDIGSNLVAFIKKSKAKTISALRTYMTKWVKKETERLLRDKKDPTIASDKVECLENLCDVCKTIADLKEQIKKLFNDDDNSKRVLLSSVHKFKGMERDRIFLIMSSFRKGLTEEESNIYYVALTRSKDKLFKVAKKYEHKDLI
jgi:superfamily I DNA/RNA helicase